VAGSCEYGDEPSGSGATDLVIYNCQITQMYVTKKLHYELVYCLYNFLNNIRWSKWRIACGIDQKCTQNFCPKS
jgi:hypothetical protein